MKFEKDHILHIGIVTADIRETAAHWAGLLNQTLPEIREIDARIEYRGTPVEAGLAVAMFDYGGVGIELLQPTDGAPSVWRETLAAKREGIHHFAFAVSDLETKVEECLRDGMTLLQKGTFRHGRYAYLDDSRRTRSVFELMEYEHD